MIEKEDDAGLELFSSAGTCLFKLSKFDKAFILVSLHCLRIVLLIPWNTHRLSSNCCGRQNEEKIF